MKSVKKIFYTAIALTATSFLMRTVGVWFNVYLTGVIGSIGIGIFQLILTVYALAKTLSYGGMNLAATRICIEEPKKMRSSMLRIMLCALSLGIFAGGLLYLLSEPIARLWIAFDKASLSLKLLSLSLPFVAVSSALNGYMTAIRKMSRYSVIQLIEQISRIVITTNLIEKVGGKSTDLSIAMISLGITFSEVISFSLALILYVYDTVKEDRSLLPMDGFFRKMSRIAVPDAVGAYVRSGLNTLEHLLIPWGIRRSGKSIERAFSDYGIVQGMALPILLYPSSILGVVGSLLVPEIAECKVKENTVQINYMINRVLSLALIFSLAIMSGMICYADELSLAIYDSKEAAHFIRLIAPLIPIMYMDMTTDGMLKGLDAQLSIMRINVLDSILCVALVWLLVPNISVDGYIITIYLAEMANFLLSFQKLSKLSKLKFRLGKGLIAPLLSSILSMSLAKKLINITENPTQNLIIAICVGFLTYYLFLRLCGAISKEDAGWLKRVVLPAKRSS